MTPEKSHIIGHRSRSLLAVAGLSALAAIAGCGELELGGAGTQSDSILDIAQPPTPIEAVAWATDEYDADKRFRGILLLSNAPWGGEPVYVEMYERALDDGDSAVRAAAVRAIARHGSPDEVPRITEMLDDEDPLLRWEAARALQRLHNTEAINPLIERLDPSVETDRDVRAAAARALGQYADQGVVFALLEGLDDRDLAVNRAALGSLRVLTGQDHGYSVADWLAWIDSTKDVFAERRQYTYPAYQRDPKLYEYLVFWKQIPNEVAAAPVGMAATPGSVGDDGSVNAEGQEVRN